MLLSWQPESMNPAAWDGPPADVLGHAAPVQQFVVRTEVAVVALQQVIAFPPGCSLMLHIAVRRRTLPRPVWEGLVTGGSTFKAGVRFPDGARATTVGNAFEGWAPPTDRPEPPMLVDVGGGSAGDDRFYRGDRQLWLWPLPPPVPFEFVIEWQDVGIATTAATLDGAAIARAAERAAPYWP